MHFNFSDELEKHQRFTHSIVDLLQHFYPINTCGSDTLLSYWALEPKVLNYFWPDFLNIYPARLLTL
jgi:hypothetical protein